jgi:hypothetical protein
MSDIFSPDYVQKQQVASLQRMAAEQNAARVQGYKLACDNWLQANSRNRDLGLPITPVPVIPKKITVGEDGEWFEAPFTDLAAPALPTPVIPPSSGSLRAAVPPVDRTDQLLAQNAVMYALLQRIAAKLGV